jgi:hypothetical protein
MPQIVEAFPLAQATNQADPPKIAKSSCFDSFTPRTTPAPRSAAADPSADISPTSSNRPRSDSTISAGSAAILSCKAKYSLVNQFSLFSALRAVRTIFAP